MTREEQIDKAARDYINDGNPCYDIESSYELDAFEKGAEWADEHPKYKWVNIYDDLPCNHKELITKDGIATLPVPTISYDGLLELHNMVKVMSSKGGDRWIWEEGIPPQYWFYLPDLN